MIISHSKPLIDTADINAVKEVLASGYISQGQRVREFETKLSKTVGVKYGVAVSSGTSALHLALTALNVGTGDEVIIPSYVCAAPYMAALNAGATPKIVDIDPSNFNISANTAKKAVTSETKAIIVPHMFGCPAELDELLELGIPIVEDCAQSLGAEYKKRRVGSFGRLCICSFYATKMITTGEGGMVLTDDHDIYNRTLEVREYDKKPLTTVRYNYKMSDIQAALGLTQLEKLKYFIERRREIAAIYSERFAEYNVTLPCTPSHRRSVFYRYVVLLDRLEHIQRAARKSGIMCERPVWEPLHKSLPSIANCPDSDYVHNHALSIPLYPILTPKEVEYVVERLEAIISRSA